MDLLSIILIGIGLAMDCFAVSIAQGLQQGRWCGKAIVMALLFGVFQGGMPLIGYGAGTVFAFFFKRFAPWIALLLLGWIGGKMMYDSLHEKDDRPSTADWSVRNMLVLAVATSIDALATGVIFIPHADQVYTGISIIAACSFLFALAGYLIGVFVGKLKENVELIGGIILVGIGIKIFIEGICF